LGSEVQEQMDKCILNNMDEYANLFEVVQRKVLEEFGYKEESDLDLFRESLGNYSYDDEVCSIPYYSKFNRARNGDLRVGDQFADVMLTDIETPSQLVSLSSYYKSQLEKKNLGPDAPFVIVAGSIT